jgi:ferredoxin-type protein NapH
MSRPVEQALPARRETAVRPPASRRSLLVRNRWLLARRVSQLVALGAFMLGPWAGIWIARGTLASSELFGVLPLTDPFAALQTLLARHRLEGGALVGAAIVVAAYVLAGGRAYCAWACPINPVTDLAAWLRTTLKIPALLRGFKPDRRLRYAMLALACLLSVALGSVAWETVNPITLLQRALVFGLAGGWGVVLAVFLFDLLLLPRGWCGHLCPVGAFYGLLGKVALTHVSAVRRDDCSGCGACFKVCPEPHVIAPALYGAQHGASPVIRSADCIRCARCIDVCDDDVFRLELRRR